MPTVQVSEYVIEIVEVIRDVCFKIQGKILKPSYGQLFVVARDETFQNCMVLNNADLHLYSIKLLDKLIRMSNIFAKTYKVIGNELKNKNESASHLQLILILMKGVIKKLGV